LQKNYAPIYYKVQISTSYRKIVLKFVVLSTTVSRAGTILPIVREKTADTKQLYVVIKLDRLDKDIFNGGNYNQYKYYVIYIAVFHSKWNHSLYLFSIWRK
jgi:hypothetical protein